jgi:hypothetical protein
MPEGMRPFFVARKTLTGIVVRTVFVVHIGINGDKVGEIRIIVESYVLKFDMHRLSYLQVPQKMYTLEDLRLNKLDASKFLSPV